MEQYRRVTADPIRRMDAVHPAKNNMLSTSCTYRLSSYAFVRRYAISMTTAVVPIILNTQGVADILNEAFLLIES